MHQPLPPVDKLVSELPFFPTLDINRTNRLVLQPRIIMPIVEGQFLVYAVRQSHYWELATTDCLQLHEHVSVACIGWSITKWIGWMAFRHASIHHYLSALCIWSSLPSILSERSLGVLK